MVFLGASNTNTKQWTNGSYVTKLPDFGVPWTELYLTNSGVDGVGAFTYYQKPDLLYTRMANYSADFALIMLGGNDFLQFHTTATFDRDFNWLLSEIANNSRDQLIFVSNIIWSPLEVILPGSIVQRFNDFQSIIKTRTQQYGFTYVDVFNVTDGQTSYYQSDLIHLNEAGHRKVAEAINNQTRDLIISSLSSLSRNMGRAIIIGIAGIITIAALVILLRKYMKTFRAFRRSE